MHVYILQFMKLGTYGGENRGGVNNLGELIRLEYVGMPYFIVWEDEYRKGNNGRVANVKVCPRGASPRQSTGTWPRRRSGKRKRRCSRAAGTLSYWTRSTLPSIMAW